MFDLQRFADDAPIPQELAGISEDIARNIMAKASQPAPENNSADGSVDAQDPENVKVSYSRFKETLDKKNEIERELAAYRERFGNLTAPPAQGYQPSQGYQQPPQDFQPPQNLQQAPQPQQQPQQPPIQNLTEDMIKNFEDAITFGAKQLSGFSDEQVDELNYLDDEDPRLKQWEFAKKIAENAVYNNYLAAQVAQQQELQRLAYMQNQSLAAFNDYVTRQQAADNFSAVEQFATNDFFNSQSDLDKLTILEARNRIGQNAASPADFMVIRDFFSRAKSAYDSRNAAPRFATAPTAPQFPRTDKVNGISGGGGGVTEASLAEMMRTVPWDQIPQEYKQILLKG